MNKTKQTFCSILLSGLAITSLCGFTSCDDDNADVNTELSHTSWETSVNNNGATGMMTLSFMDAKNGVLKEDLQDKDGQKYTAYHEFTYEAVTGVGALHFNNQCGFSENQLIFKSYVGTDLSVNVSKDAKTLELRGQDNQVTFTSTEFKSIFLPVMDFPQAGASDIKLTDEMLEGHWYPYCAIFEYLDFYYHTIKDGGYATNVVAKQPMGKLTTVLVNVDNMYSSINNNTIVLYEDKERSKIKYYLVFEDVLSAEMGFYNVSLKDADEGVIMSSILHKEW